jgi:hypothetical protein
VRGRSAARLASRPMGRRGRQPRPECIGVSGGGAALRPGARYRAAASRPSADARAARRAQWIDQLVPRTCRASHGRSRTCPRRNR